MYRLSFSKFWQTLRYYDEVCREMHLINRAYNKWKRLAHSNYLFIINGMLSEGEIFPACWKLITETLEQGVRCVQG